MYYSFKCVRALDISGFLPSWNGSCSVALSAAVAPGVACLERAAELSPPHLHFGVGKSTTALHQAAPQQHPSPSTPPLPSLSSLPPPPRCPSVHPDPIAESPPHRAAPDHIARSLQGGGAAWEAPRPRRDGPSRTTSS
jgi:hypothetical protein